MSYPLLLLLLGFLFTVLFGLMSILRREGLSTRLAVEATVLTLLGAGLAQVTGVEINPAFFLIVMYLVTMRVRLLADLGVLLASQGRVEAAQSAFGLALRLWPDSSSRLVTLLNQGVAFLKTGAVDQAIANFQTTLKGKDILSLKNEAAANYNLGMAYLKKGMEPEAYEALRQAIEASPSSEYGRRAEAYLKGRNIYTGN